MEVEEEVVEAVAVVVEVIEAVEAVEGVRPAIKHGQKLYIVTYHDRTLEHLNCHGKFEVTPPSALSVHGLHILVKHGSIFADTHGSALVGVFIVS